MKATLTFSKAIPSAMASKASTTTVIRETRSSSWLLAWPLRITVA